MKLTRTAFPPHLKSLRSLMPEILGILEDGRKDDWYSFVWLEEDKTLAYTASFNETSAESLDRGLVMRVMIGGTNFERSTNQLDRAHLLQLARDFRAELDSSFQTTNGLSYQPMGWDAEDLDSLGKEMKEQLLAQGALTPQTEVHFAPLAAGNPYEADIAAFKELASGMRKELLERSKKEVAKNPAFKELADVRSLLRQRVTTHVFVDRAKNMSQTLPIPLFYSQGSTKTGHSARTLSGGLGGMELAVHSESEKNEVALRPLQLENAKKLAPGRYKIISGPDVTGVIAHEAFGHTQEGDTWMKGRSIAQGLEASKTKVGNEQASIVNHPNMFSMEDAGHGTNGSYFFDHEGQLARPQKILDQGLLLPPMTDLTSAMRLKVPRTANGKRETWRRPLMTRQTNTYFTPGDKTLEELIGMVDNGFLAKWASGGMEDPKGGSLTAGTAYLEEIKDGKLTGEIFLGPSGGHVELSDPVFTLLERIVAKSKSVHAEGVPDNKYGGCGKYHKEGVDAGCGGPYILWESINCG